MGNIGIWDIFIYVKMQFKNSWRNCVDGILGNTLYLLDTAYCFQLYFGYCRCRKNDKRVVVANEYIKWKLM